jgi:hypothetical protein
MLNLNPGLNKKSKFLTNLMLNIYIYIYIYREREREREQSKE